MGKQLTKHFHTREFDCHNGTPVPARDYNGLEALCRQYLEPLRSKYGACTVNSGYRTAAYNASIGGASQSYHIYTIHDGNDQAADVRFARGTARDWHRTANWLRAKKRNGRGGLGLYSSFIHIDIRDYKSDWRG